jgi:hypothetical protein
VNYQDIYFIQNPKTDTYTLTNDGKIIDKTTITQAWVYCDGWRIQFNKNKNWKLEAIYLGEAQAYWNDDRKKQLEDYLLNHPILRLHFITN